VPLAVYYAFKQTETAGDLVTSSGWAAFLQAIAGAGLAVDGTWPLRTENASRMHGQTSNALASSIVLVCRKREEDAGVATREALVRGLRREMPAALHTIRAAGVGPVDMAQAAIGPGMGVFSRYRAVLEDSGDAMSVRAALALINQIRDEIDHDDDAAYDPETRFALDWFGEAGWEPRDSSRAILLANAKNLALDRLSRLGMIETSGGKARLIPREALDPRYDPAEATPTVWQAAQHLAQRLVSPDGGQEKAAVVFAGLSVVRELVRALAYRLYGLAERKGWAQEALVWNRLAEEWRAIEDIAEQLETGPPARGTTPDLFGARR
jgi:putative DNA methylase